MSTGETWEQTLGLLARLRQRGALGVDEYERNLMNNQGCPEVLMDLILEGWSALSFLDNDFKTTLRDRPDLKLELGNEVVFAEVKHMRETEQDRKDDEAMKAPGDDLVRYGDTTMTDEPPADEQIARVLMEKVLKYDEEAPFIVIIQSSTRKLEFLFENGVDKYCEMLGSDPRLDRLSAFMLVESETCFSGGRCNTKLHVFPQARRPLSDTLVPILQGMRWNRRPA